MKNKRADIPVTMLVFGVFALFLFAIISFFVSSNHVQNNTPNLEVFENLTSSLQSFYYYLHAGYSQQEAAKMVGGVIKNNKLTLNANDGKTIYVTYIIDLNK